MRFGMGLGLGLGSRGGGWPNIWDLDMPTIALSLRKLCSGATRAIKVRRLSDDETLDIGFSGSNLDIDALETFCAGTDGYVDTWYDQSDGANHFVQAVTSLQPKIVHSGAVLRIDGNPAIIFIRAAGTHLRLSKSGLMETDWFVSAMVFNDSIDYTDERDFIIEGSATASTGVLADVTFIPSVFYGGGSGYTAYSAKLAHGYNTSFINAESEKTIIGNMRQTLISGHRISADESLTVSINSAVQDIGSGTPTTKPPNYYVIGSYRKADGRFWSGSMQEIIVYGKSDIDAAAINANIKSKWMPQRIEALAHRGYRAKYPEQTVMGIEGCCIETTHRFMEFDLHITSDGKFVCYHDANLGSITNVAEVYPDGSPWAISGLTLAQIQDAADNGGTTDLLVTNGEYSDRIATLEELLAVCKTYNKIPVIELKNTATWTQELVDAALNIINNAGFGLSAIITSFSKDNLELVRTSEVPIGDTIDIWVSTDTTSDFASAANVAWMTDENVRCNGAFIKWGVSSKNQYITIDNMSLMHKLGIKVAVWVTETDGTDTAVNALQMATYGADYWCTDSPTDVDGIDLTNINNIYALDNYEVTP